MKKTKQKNSKSLFDEDLRLQKLSKHGDPLLKLNNINWEMFRPLVEQATLSEDKGQGGRPPYDRVLLFKIVVLQKFYNISNEQIEYQINDRLSFMRFLDLSLADDVPDCNTVWLFKEMLVKAGVYKDLEARWTKKNNKSYYGYKDHVKVDVKSKLIKDYCVTDASVHDSQALDELLDESDKDKELYADSAYVGQDDILERYGVISKINEKGYRNKPLTKTQKHNNRKKSKIRARVEHVFGFIENSMKGSTVKSIGIKRAEGSIGLMNLTYNIFRYLYLCGV